MWSPLLHQIVGHFFKIGLFDWEQREEWMTLKTTKNSTKQLVSSCQSISFISVNSAKASQARIAAVVLNQMLNALQFVNSGAFETLASKGAVLTMPKGGLSLRWPWPPQRSLFEINARKRFEFIPKIRVQNILNGELRLVIRCDKISDTLSDKMSDWQQTTRKLKFKALDTASFTITYLGMLRMVEVRVGPDRREIKSMTMVATLLIWRSVICALLRTMTATALSA